MSDADKIRIKLDAIRILLREIEGVIDSDSVETGIGQESGGSASASGQEPGGNLEKAPLPVSSNPYADTPDMIPLINDDHLEAHPKIMDNTLSSCYWRIIWEIADRAKVKFVVMRGAHPDGAIDVAYPEINGELDRMAMGRIREAFLELAVPHYPPGEEWRDVSPADLRVGSDVWTIPQPKHISVDDNFHHRFDDKEYAHFHMDVRTGGA